MNIKNVSFEEIQADFISQNYSMIVSPYVIKRIQKGDDRFYITLNDNNPTFYLSVTSFASRSLRSPQLEKWRGDLGNDFADFVSDRSAEYGTFLHIEIGEFLKCGFYDSQSIPDKVLNYLLTKEIYSDSLFMHWVDKAHNDLASFAQFAFDKKLEVVSIEFPVVSKDYRLGGCIDIVCKLEFNKKRVNAIIDIKSGRKGFYESHELQLNIYKDLWNQSFSDVFEVNHVFNWSPKEWRTNKPTYNFKNQTSSKIAYTHLVNRALAEGWSEPKSTITRIKGIIELGKDLSENIEVYSLKDYIINTNKNKNDK